MRIYSLLKALFTRQPPVTIEQIPLKPGETRLTTAALAKQEYVYDLMADEGLLDPSLDDIGIHEYDYLLKDVLHAGRDLQWLQ